MHFANYLDVMRIERTEKNQIWAGIAIQETSIPEARVVGPVLLD
jgi:hypothetical protein